MSERTMQLYCLVSEVSFASQFDRKNQKSQVMLS